MTTEILKDEVLGLQLVLSTATAEIGIYHTILADHAIQEEKASVEVLGDLKSISRRVLHTVLYPAMIACVINQSGFDHWPISFEEFCQVPESLEVPWEEMAYRLNPHWMIPSPTPEEEKDLRKKVTPTIPVSQPDSPQ